MTRSATSQEIDRFLELFGHNKEDAIHALRQQVIQGSIDGASYVKSESREEGSPLGDVIIQVDSLSKNYKARHQQLSVLKGVSLRVRKGEFIAITGSSGSGKSTLLQLIGGLDKPSEGTVTIDGHNLNKMNDRELSIFRNRTIGFVFQFFYLQPFLRLETNLAIAGMPARIKRSILRKRARELATAVGLSERLKHFPKELSGGQIQRAAIARALMNNPKIILADEPTGNLDSTSSKEVIDLFEKIQHEFGTTIVVVTHDINIANRANRIVTLKDGELV